MYTGFIYEVELSISFSKSALRSKAARALSYLCVYLKAPRGPSVKQCVTEYTAERLLSRLLYFSKLVSESVWYRSS